MRGKLIIIFTFLLLIVLSWFAFIKPAFTGRVAIEQSVRVVVILKPEADSANLITGGAALDEPAEKTVEEIKADVAEVQQEVIDDINKPSLIDRILGIESEPEFEVERAPETLPALIGNATPDAVAELQDHPLVEAVYPDFEFELLLNDSVPLINADDVWNITVNGVKLDGAGSTVCVIDTGIDNTHPAFTGRIKAEHCYCSSRCCPNGQAEDTLATDTNSISHGTHVSGIVASNGTYKGVAPGASIVAVKVCQASCSFSDILSGIDFCVAHKEEYGIDVISGSLGDSGNYKTLEQCPGYFDTAMQTAYNLGIVSVFASGNNAYTQGISYPACSPWAVSVGATDDNDNIASFSNRGPLLDVLAPGVSIYSSKANNNYGTLSGTSQATPHVSGVIALIKQYARLRNITLTPANITQLLRDTGVMVQDWPRIDAYAAITALMPTQPNMPPVVDIVSPENNSTLYSPVSFQGTAVDEEDGNLTNITWSSNIDGILGNGNSIIANLSEGDHTITLKAIDSLGAQGLDSINIEIITNQTNVTPPINNTPPVVTITSPANNSTVYSPLNFQGIVVDAEDGNLTNITWSSNIDGMLGTGNSIITNLSLGNFTITLTAIDSYEEQGSDSINITVAVPPVNNTPPVVEIISPANNSLKESPVNLIGSATDAEDGELVGEWFENAESLGVGNALSVTFKPGEHNILFTAKDSANVSASASVVFTSRTCQLDFDQNSNDRLDIGDVVILLTSFAQDDLPCNSETYSEGFCIAELDFNGNNGIDIGDFVLLLTGLVNENIYNRNGESCFPESLI